ncbi:MAG TPA: T9SS type A sorting domain-containing protein [Bacteroidia bacterium]|jgi:sugar lactone lactonase YvrE|nr:T9SS type A sorting domain-containing protein [Bacteroidia bacterium]
MKRIYPFLTVLFLIFFTLGKAQIISTIAGNYIASHPFGGYSGDGGPATAAELGLPIGVALDDTGNIFIGEFGNGTIRKVSATTGIITTIAGNGHIGFGGYGGQATSAFLAEVNGITIDKSGNLFIADGNGNVILKIVLATGVINIVAGNGYKALTGYGGYSGDGGQATDAELWNPSSVAIDDSNNVLFADEKNNRVRKVNVISGLISTVAGKSVYGYTGDGGPAKNAEMHGPTGLALDSFNNIYIADGFNTVIRKVDATTGIITTIAGNGHGGDSGDGGPATAAGLTVNGVSFDKFGNMYIADGNYKIRMVTPDSIIHSVAGITSGGYSGDSGPATDAELLGTSNVAFDSLGNIYISDASNNVIRKVTGNLITTGLAQQNLQKVKIYPNPSKGIFNLSFSSLENSCKVKVYTLLGDEINSSVLGKNNSNFILDLSAQPAGIYFYRILKDNGAFVGSGKLVIDH